MSRVLQQTKTITGSSDYSAWTWKHIIQEYWETDSKHSDYYMTSNKSIVVIESYLGRSGSASYFGGTGDVKITADTKTSSSTKTYTYPTDVPKDGYVSMYVAEFTIEHNDDGSKKISTSSSLSGANFKPYNASASGDITLTTIPRATPAPTLTATIGTPMYITISPKAADTFYHRIHLTVGGTGYWLKSDGSITTSGSGYSTFGTSTTSMKFNAPTSLYSKFTGKSTTGTIKVYTYKRTWKISTQSYEYTQIGSTTSNSFTLNCNASKCTPVISGTVVDTNSTTLALTGNENNIVANASYATITPIIKSISDTDDTATTISYMYIDGIQFYGETTTVTKPSKKSFLLRVVNSRGYPAEYTVTASGKLIPYTPLTFNILNLKRPEPTTGEVAINYDGNYFNGDFKEGRESTLIQVGDLLTTDGITLSFPDNFYEELQTMETGYTSVIFKTNTYQLYESHELLSDIEYYYVWLRSLDENATTNYPVYMATINYSLSTPEVEVNINSTNLGDIDGEGTIVTFDMGSTTEVNTETFAHKYINLNEAPDTISNELILGWVYRETNTDEWLGSTDIVVDVDYSDSVLVSTIPDSFGSLFLDSWNGENTIYTMASNDTYELRTVVSSSGTFVWVMLRDNINNTSKTIYRYTTTSGVQENNSTLQLPIGLGAFTTVDVDNELYQYLKIAGMTYLTGYTIKDNNTYSGNESLGTMFDYTKSYEFIFYCYDKITGLELPGLVSRGLPVFWWDANNLYVNGKIHADNVRTTASYQLSTETISSGSILNVGDLIYNDTNDIIDVEYVDNDAYGGTYLKINRDGYIKISYNVWFNGTTTGRPWLQCYRCRVTEDNNLEWFEAITASISDSTATFVTLSASDVIFRVNNGDLITLYMTTANGDISINTGAGSYPPSYITIELL